MYGKPTVHERLRELFAQYECANLVGVSASDFRQHIEGLIGTVDETAEGYSAGELARQRDLSVKFYWGHDHDFGTFKLDGRMRERHFDLLERFVGIYPVSLDDFAGADVFDIGCWTGGTALTLAALGAKVFAIEEVSRYADAARYLASAFGVADRLSVESRSLYSCNDAALHDRFDIVYFPGVVYHLSDPLIGLRILYNSLRTGGRILVESAGIDHPEPFCRFDGSGVVHYGSRERLDRGGWNWFMPSASALARMMAEAGFEDIDASWQPDAQRVYAYGRKARQVGICKAGLSVPDIR